MKFNLEKLKQLATPLPEQERQDMEYQIENRDWLLKSVQLALKIRSIMAEIEINQSELARRMGVSPAQVGKILSGQENLGLKTIAKVEAALGQPLYNVQIDDDIHEVSMRETVKYVPLPIFISNKPVENNISSKYAMFNFSTQTAFS